MNRRRFLAGLLAVAPLGFIAAMGGQASKASYTNDVAPILKAHCFSCHSGSDASGKLDLSNPAAIFKGGVSGVCVVAGNPDGSLLLQRILGKGGKPAMPMGFPALKAEDVQKIRNWIAEGAHSDAGKATHWAYVKPVRPAVPEVKLKGWVRNPIDAFTLARMESQGLRPSPEASKETLIRRVSLDLIGLPPTPKEIDAFLADKAPGAYERLVDRLLASPHYGERQARPWLDLARYADSDGYEKDLNRVSWKYRDWVIDAYNKNLPYDRFTIDQLAGDLLPFNGVDNLVATGFNRNSQTNREGGVDQSEAYFNVVLDRVNTTASVWLGSTLQCARCHDHKYDPFTQKDYYKMAAFYGNGVIFSDGTANINDDTWRESKIPLPSGVQVAKQTQLVAERDLAKNTLSRMTPMLTDAYEKWKMAANMGVDWSVLKPSLVKDDGGATFAQLADGSTLVSGANPAKNNYHVSVDGDLKNATALRLEVLPDKSLAQNGPGRGGNMVVTKVSLMVDGVAKGFSTAVADYSQNHYPAEHALHGGDNDGWAIGGQEGKSHSLVLRLASPLPASSKVRVDIECQSRYPRLTLGRFRLSSTTSAVAETSVAPEEVRQSLAKQSLSAAETESLQAYFRSITPLLATQRDDLTKAQAKLEQLQQEIPTALIMQDKPADGPLKYWVHHRGEYLSKTEEVTANTPAVLSPMASSLPSNRLGLAEWLVSKDNPLTARVEVNRMWEELFGRGLVETSEDFGTQGSRPLDQPLLDWMATEFMRRNWDMKAMNRLIVTSATYRQSSDASKELMAKDPQNVYFARGPRFRIEAELLRDAYLVEGGILNPKMGGPSVMPIQPDGVWNTPANDEQWMESKGDDRFRRGIYTFWKRSSPYPSFMAFDATSREECTVRRIRTNTPLQALAMLNDQSVFIAARGLGKTMLKEGVGYGFRACTGRKPTPVEMTRLSALVEKLKKRFEADPAGAKKLAGTPDEAAYTLTANVLMNLDETLTKG